MPALIGLGHKSRVGKDTAAEALVALGWERRAFADGVREMALALPIRVGARDLPLATYVDTFGWDRAKTLREVTDWLDTLGRATRRLCGERVWMDRVMTDLPERCVITDVRTVAEAEAIRAAGGRLVRIDRPCVGHERPMDSLLDHWSDWDAVLVNDGSPEDLHVAIAEVATA